ARTSFFTFDTNGLEQSDLKRHLNNETKEDNQEKIVNSLMINIDERTNTMSTNGLSQDDNSNHSSTNSNSQNTSSRSLSQMFKASGENKSRLSSSSPLSADRKPSPLSSTNNKSQSNMSSMSPQQQGNRHVCSHPDCAKVFANKSALAKHKLTHCQDRRHKCVKCNKGFKRLDHLHGHMLTHEEEKPHKCRVPDCNRTYCDARSLKRHIENAHQNILAAIHEGGHDEYRRFLPETAFVKTKDLSSDFSIDSVDSNSPRSSSIDNDQGYHVNQLRSSNGHKLVPTYTFDEEKCVECHICKKSFKNGAALNGHMRLHGGFNDKQPSPSSTDNVQKKKRITPPGPNDRRQIKRKRPNSPVSSNDSPQRPILQRSMPIKSEEDDYMLMSPSSNPAHQSNLHSYQQSMYPTLPPCSDVLQQRFYDRTLSSRTRSISSSVIQTQTNSLSHPTIKNPMSVQPVPNISKQNRKQIPLPSQVYDRNNNHPYGFDLRMNDDALHSRINMNNHNSNHSLNIPAGILRFDQLTNAQMFSNVGTMPNYEDKIKKTLSVDETLKYYHQDRQINEYSSAKHPQSYLYGRSMSTQHHPTTFSQFPVSPHAPTTLAPNIFHQILRHTNDMLNKEFYISRNDHLSQHHANIDDSMRYTPSTSPYATHLYHSPSPHIVHSPADRIPNPTASVINTPVTSPYSNLNTSHCSPASSTDMCNNNPASNSMQPSPLTNSVLSHAALKKRILNALKQEAQDEQQHNQVGQDFSPTPEQNTDQDNKSQTNAETSSDNSSLKVIPVIDSPIPDTAAIATATTIKSASGFLIGTPSSSSTTTTTVSSSSASSDTTHFNYENLPPTIPAQVSEQSTANSNNSSFQWPSQVSQFRRQQSLNIASQTSNPLPTTPYTPPPMLSPFRKGPGLYYQVFSQTTPAATQQTITVPTPSLPFTPVPDEISGPKINIGEKYQAVIPKLRTNLDDNSVEHDELLFSPSGLDSLDETALDKYEQLSRTNPLLFSPRHSPTLYPIELVYMLLHEYKGDLQRTLSALLDGTASDIKQCRPLHRYHFPECDTWTQEEINAFTKAMDSSEKNFLAISRAVGTKTVKQCIEFHYMPKVHFTNRETSTNSLATKRKRLQMIKAKQLHSQKQIYDDDISSSPSCNEFRMDDDNATIISDNSTITVFSCDIDDCLQTFTSERAYRAHRNDHRRIRNTGTPPANIKSKSKS
ncbi:unnamed protein product, partial [Adineta ricciae]